jgi:CheY-like chemotaxis protein
MAVEMSQRGGVPRIVIIDDDEAFARKAARLLGSLGIVAHFHHGPFGTINAVRQTASDGVLLDVNMPSLDGLSLARMLTSTFGERVRVFLCSNMDRTRLLRMAEGLGLQGAITKDAFEENRSGAILSGLGVHARSWGPLEWLSAARLSRRRA